MKQCPNKKLVLDFYINVISDRNSDHIDQYIADHYIQHSPSLKDGKAGLREAIQYLKQLPKANEHKTPIVLAIEEDGYVMLLLDLNFMGKRLSVTDLFKVIDGKIVEHWDAVQDLTSTELNVPMFEIHNGMVLSNEDKEIVRRLLRDRSARVHRLVTEGDVVGAQCEVNKSGKRYVSYDFFKVVDEKIVQSWSVEQEMPDVLFHANGVI